MGKIEHRRNENKGTAGVLGWQMGREIHILVHFWALLSAKLLMHCNISRVPDLEYACPVRHSNLWESSRAPPVESMAKPRPKSNLMHFKCHRTHLVRGVFVPVLASWGIPPLHRKSTMCRHPNYALLTRNAVAGMCRTRYLSDNH